MPKASVKAATNEFFIYDIIDDFWGIGAKDFKQFLEMNSDAQEIHIHINSPGGSAFEGRAIASLIRAFKGVTVCHVDGIAASAASVVAVACDEVRMGVGTMLMIHNAWSVVGGNKDDFIAQAELLEKCDQAMAADYEMKTGLAHEEIVNMMNAETWLSADEAVEKKFADMIDLNAEKQDTSAFNLAAYNNTPENLLHDQKQEPKVSLEPNYEALRQANERRLQLYQFV